MANFPGTALNDIFNGTNGADTFTSGGGGDDRFNGKGGADIFDFGIDFNDLDQVNGGSGLDTLRITGDHVGANAVFFAATTITGIETMQLAGGFNYDFTMDDANVAAGDTLTVDNSAVGAAPGSLRFDGSHESDGHFSVLGSIGNDILIGGALSDKVYGGDAADNLKGLGGADTMRGDNGNDFITGGAGGDSITPGNGSDTVICNPLSDSTSTGYDTVRGFDFAGVDVFQLPVAVAGTNPAFAGGNLTTATFDADMAAAVNAGTLFANNAVLWTPGGGGLGGQLFAIVDANGVAGYQAGQDYVFHLVASANLGAFNAADFI